ncbi:MAG: hypothetical protein RJA58_1038 [Pseudomonadota bacterium]|jgi:hypothetical protein
MLTMQENWNEWAGDARPHGLRQELAAAAAALIAEEGLDYASAKRKAYDRATGGHGSRLAKQDLPSNEEVEDALREYQQIFQADHQPQRLASLRQKTLALMQLLSDFRPMTSGAIVNGTASDHTDIHIQCYADNAKALGFFLLDQSIDSEATELEGDSRSGRGRQQRVEALVIQWQGELAIISVYPETDQRMAQKTDSRGRLLRADIAGLAQLIEDTQPK